MHRSVVQLIFFGALWISVGCGTDDVQAPGETPPEHDVSEDLQVVPETDSKGDDVLPFFDPNTVVADDFYTDFDSIDTAAMQAFLEDSPYDNRSWMADFEVRGTSAAQMVVNAARRQQINPIMLLVRLQVEQGLISKADRPTQRKIDRALGCGCFDGQSCSASFLGFENQLDCAAETHRRLYDLSRDDGNTDWVKGKSRETLDNVLVRPSNHATAALYGYTPWVLVGRGGNWLVWNVARKYVRHLESLGLFTPTVSPFVGTPCTRDSDCEFDANGEPAFCFEFIDFSGQQRGFCTLSCEGFCPDMTGRATTFCIDSGTVGLGICASKAEPINNDCADLPGTLVEERERFVGSSGASESSAQVCAPDTF